MSEPKEPPVMMIGPSAPKGPPEPIDMAADSGFSTATFGSTLLPASLADRRITPPEGGSYAYGIMRSGDWIGHGGNVHGWVAMTAFDMKTGTTFVAIVNSGGGEGALEPLAAYLLPDAPFTQ